MRTFLPWIVAVMAASGAACAGTAGQPTERQEAGVVSVTPELLSEGRAAYRKYCVQCHGFSGKGDGVSARALDPPPRDHTDAAVMNGIGDDIIAETVLYGGAGRGYPGMPSFPTVSSDELVALVAYVRSLSRPEVSSIEIGDLD